MKQSLFLVIAAATLLLAACARVEQPVACTMDAKICPDGTAVGRVGPSCEFAPCPDSSVPEMPPFVEGSTFMEYKSTDPAMCARMKFTCDEDEYFGDETGCGCVRKHQNPAVTTCSADYDPVCGWSNASIQCFAYPCASTYSNLCQASIVSSVASTTPGECPAPGSSPDASGRKYVSTNQSQCAASMWLCVEGLQQFYDETGCGCEPIPSGKKQAIDCTDPRPQACTKEYMPVCGQLQDGTTDTYGNKCTACADSNVISYVADACGSDSLGLVAGTQCEDPRPEMCTMQYDPVCARRADGSTFTAGNACSACGDKDVQWHSPGECTSDEENILK